MSCSSFNRKGESPDRIILEKESILDWRLRNLVTLRARQFMRVRTYEIGDTQEIVQLFYDTVREVNIRDYTKAQVDAWAPADIDLESWTESLSSKFTFVAEEGGKIAGFGELEANGHIDRFYCHKDFQRKGVGSQILEKIELQAKSLAIKKIFTEASITAKPFFASKGFTAVKQQEVERRGQKFVNFVMEKTF